MQVSKTFVFAVLGLILIQSCDDNPVAINIGSAVEITSIATFGGSDNDSGQSVIAMEAMPYSVLHKVMMAI